MSTHSTIDKHPEPSREMSRTATNSSSTVESAQSPSRTLTDLNAPAKVELPEDGTTDKALEKREEANRQAAVDALSSLSAGRKNLLFLAFTTAMFVDAAGVSATFILTSAIAQDLGIVVNDEAWVLGTYSLAFASTLLFSGRLADVFRPNVLFSIGFTGISVTYLCIGFITTSAIAFYIVRAISALFAVLTIPSAINMIIQMFPDREEQAKRLAFFGLSGALANTIAVVLAGAFIEARWSWYFWFICILTAPFAVVTYILLPNVPAVAGDLRGLDKLKRLDLGGVFLIMAGMILFILAFTQAPIAGWDSAIFIAPLIIGVALFAVFIVYEQKMPRGYTLLPHDIWRFPNIFPLIIQASAAFLYFACIQLRLASYFQAVLGNSAIIAAVKLLPMGVTALVIGGLISALPWLITKPKFVQPVCSALAFAGGMLIAFSGGGHGNKYWSMVFVGEIIGTAGGMLIFIGMNTAIIQSFPLESAGVGGSFAQIVFQIFGVLGVAIQSGIGGNNLADWTGTQNSYYFVSAYVILAGAIFAVWYRQDKMPKGAAPVTAA